MATRRNRISFCQCSNTKRQDRHAQSTTYLNTKYMSKGKSTFAEQGIPVSSDQTHKDRKKEQRQRNIEKTKIDKKTRHKEKRTRDREREGEKERGQKMTKRSRQKIKPKSGKLEPENKCHPYGNFYLPILKYCFEIHVPKGTDTNTDG